jgi:hypothetical protein
MKGSHPIPNVLRRSLLLLTALVVLFASSTVFAQSCSLCYTQAAASTARFIQALRSGILILMVPPMLMSIAFTVVAYRRRNEFHSTR